MHSPFQRTLAGAGCLVVGALSSVCAWSAEGDDDELFSDRPAYFFRAGARALFNVKASSSLLDKPAQPGVYDDGFVKPDIGGEESVKTWNWGYQNEEQLQGSQLEMKQLTGLPKMGEFSDETDDPNLGAEFMFGAEIYRFILFNREARIGFETGYAFNNFSVEERGSSSGMARLTTYAFGGGPPTFPVAPYQGTFQGPGPLLDLNPSSTIPVDSTVEGTFRGELESDIHTFKVGFWFEYPITQRLFANLSIGYASLFADTDYTYTQGYTFGSAAIDAIGPAQESIRDRGWNPGAYFQLRGHYEFTRHVDAFLGLEYEYVEDFNYRDKGREVNLQFSSLFVATVGVGFHF